MRSILAVVLWLAAAAAPAADLSDAQTFLGQTAFDEVQVSPDGSRLAFITRRNDFERDREAYALWLTDLAGPGASPVLPRRPPSTGSPWTATRSGSPPRRSRCRDSSASPRMASGWRLGAAAPARRRTPRRWRCCRSAPAARRGGPATSSRRRG